MPLRFVIIWVLCAMLGATPLRAGETPTTFNGAREAWRLTIGPEGAKFDERPSGVGQLWVSRELTSSSLHGGRSASGTFRTTHVAAGEAVDQFMTIAVSFAREPCRDRRGRRHPFSVTLRFDGEPEAQRGCGARLP